MFKRFFSKKSEELRHKFDKDWYLTEYSDVREAGVDPIKHYLEFGEKEGRYCSKIDYLTSEFDIDWYLTEYSDVREAGVDPIKHYLEFGEKEGRIFKRKQKFFFDGTKIPEKIVFKKEDTPQVSIIIPVYNQAYYTKQCLYSVLKNTSNVSYEIIIADDNSIDSTVFISDFAENITVVRNNKNFGYIRNCNNAAKYARGTFVCFLNNDTFVYERWLYELYKIISTNDKVGVVGSKIISTDGTMQECGVYCFADLNFAASDNNPDLYKYQYLRQADYVSGCSLMTTKKLFDTIGGFDEAFSPAYCDDPDYCFAVKNLGFDVLVQPKSKLLHFGSISYSSANNNLMAVNNKVLQLKWNTILGNKVVRDDRKIPFTGKTRPRTIVVIDDLFPQFDKHAGGKTIFQFLNIFVKMGLYVKFCPFFANEQEEPYFSILNDLGIETIHRNDIYEYLSINEDLIDYIFISRPNVAINFMMKSLKACGIKVFYYGHDIHHLRMERGLSFSDDFSIDDVKKMKDVETIAVESSTCAFYPSNIEKEYMEKITKNANVASISPYIYDSECIPSKKLFHESKDIIFVGSSHGPNLDGLLWFINDILPKIVSSIPNIKLHIVGSSLSKEILELDSPNIVVHGYLSEEKLADLYNSVRLSVAPLRYGAGVKGKIVNSLYYGVPVVTTSIGAEGMPSSKAIASADSSDEFSAKVIAMYSNEKEYNSFISESRDIIRNNFSFDQAETVFSRFINAGTRANDCREF